MVADSKVTDDDGELPTYSAAKIIRFSGGIAGASGEGGNCMRFLEWAKGDFAPPQPKFSDDKFTGLILNNDGLFIFIPSFPTAEKLTGEGSKFYAIGSGGELARLAMRLGCDPKKAVLLACEYDESSAPPLQVLRLRKPKSKRAKQP